MINICYIDENNMFNIFLIKIFIIIIFVFNYLIINPNNYYG